MDETQLLVTALTFFAIASVFGSVLYWVFTRLRQPPQD